MCVDRLVVSHQPHTLRPTVSLSSSPLEHVRRNKAAAACTPLAALVSHAISQSGYTPEDCGQQLVCKQETTDRATAHWSDTLTTVLHQVPPRLLTQSSLYITQQPTSSPSILRLLHSWHLQSYLQAFVVTRKRSLL